MKYNIIAIEREYASGGQLIGSKLSERLSIPCYGREILEMAAKRRGTSTDYLEHMEETATSSLLYSLYLMSHVATGSEKRPASDELHLLESGIIHELAAKGPCILLGRCASHVLRERSDVLRVFIRAGLDTRRARAQETYGVPEAEVDRTLKAIDRRRENYYTASTGRKWRDREGYDLVLDSGRLGFDRCARVLEECMK